MKRQDPDTLPSGILIIDKAKDMTSHDVVAIARGALKIRKIGHCGTLDPMATGVLVLLINKATKLQDMLMADDKVYDGTLTLGVTTDSQDAEGDVVETKPVPDFSEDEVTDVFEKFTGAFEQIPPMVSAIKKDGVPLYKLARKGKEVKRDPRPVHITSYKLDRISLPEVDCTYAHDIGQDLGCGAHLSALRRTRSGKFNVDRAMTAADLKTASAEDIKNSLISLAEISLMRGA